MLFGKSGKVVYCQARENAEADQSWAVKSAKAAFDPRHTMIRQFDTRGSVSGTPLLHRCPPMGKFPYSLHMDPWER